MTENNLDTIGFPIHGRVYDSCCGSGGMFVQSARFVHNHRGNINVISDFGQDSNPTTWKMAQINLAIRGIKADLSKYNADTFHGDCDPTLKADFIMANPPFNISSWGADRLQEDVRWKYGIPSDCNVNYAWITSLKRIPGLSHSMLKGGQSNVKEQKT